MPQTTLWAVLGAGRFAADRMVPAILSAPGARLAGVWARNPIAAEALAEAYGAKAYASLDAVVDAQIDIAYVAATAESNPHLVAPLLAAGIPVLCEKPIAPTSAEARRLAELASQTGTPCYVNHHLRANDCMTVARASIRTGVLGRVRQVLISNQQLMPQPPGWRLADPRSGGVVRDLTIHDVDLTQFLLEEELRVESAAAVARRQNVETTVDVSLSSDSGVTISFFDGWVTPPGTPHSRLTVVGDRGSLTIDPAVTATGSRLTITTPAGRMLYHQGADAYEKVPRFAADGARGAPVPLATAQAAVATMAVIDDILDRIAPGGSP